MSTTHKDVFRWLVFVLALGYLAVFYQYVQAYKESLKNNRFQYNQPFVIDTRTGATYVYGDEISPQRPAIFTYPIEDILIPQKNIERKDSLGILGDRNKAKINPVKAKVLYDEASKYFDLGAYDEYLRKLQSPEKRKLLYDKISSKFDLGTYEEYEAKLILGDPESAAR